MIVGKLVDLYRYKGISKNIDTAIDYIQNHDLLALPKGKTIVDGDNVYINRDTYVARPMEECFYENHENYIDLQIVLKGKEIFGYTHISNPTLEVTTPYNKDKDVTKYKCDGAVLFTLEEGFALVYTEDVHLAKCKVNDEIVEKAVVKIKIEK
ncbi:TPA: YhcH/YjgK/YiaL family protein [Candidatus Avacholeplasma faecigallinarum]|mgnify:CR=1 FL=1|nr:YhcH/YjgK/YiaL family protein [Candidatus Avacholeplasma faecigallinarum]